MPQSLAVYPFWLLYHSVNEAIRCRKPTMLIVWSFTETVSGSLQSSGHSRPWFGNSQVLDMGILVHCMVYVGTGHVFS